MLSIIKNIYYNWVLIPYLHFRIRNYLIADSITTINYIIKNKCSVSRYGDGEFNIIQGIGNGFQNYNIDLAKRLKEILKIGSTSKHIVCVPYTLKSTKGNVKYTKEFWGYYLALNKNFLFKILSPQKQYYDTQMTRFYIEYKSKKHCEFHIRLLQKIWNKRDIVIIEGIKTRSGIGNNLYSNCHSIKRILCPAENAFDKYSEILDSIKSNVSQDSLILISLGMTATVLAYDLSQLGYQAIDLGHLDVEYEWFLAGATSKVPIKNKYVNEVGNKDSIEECKDELYLSQIIKIIQ